MSEITKEQLIDHIANMTVLELSELSRSWKKFGVSAALQPLLLRLQQVALVVARPQPKKTEFDVVLDAAGEKKINVIKEIRAITGLGLKEAKEFVESAPKTVKEGCPKEEAEEIVKKLQEAGASASIK